MNLGIPERLYQLLVAIGLFLIAYGFLRIDNSYKDYFKYIDRYRTYADSLEYLRIKRKESISILQEKARLLSKKYNTDNQIQVTDSTLIFIRALGGADDATLVTEKLETFWNNYEKLDFQIELLSSRVDKESHYLDERKSLKDSHEEESNQLLMFGSGLFVLGLFMWISTEIEPQKRKVFCESCGKRFSAMCTHGTNSDGSKNDFFCKNCFDNGEFVNPNLTESDVVQEVKKQISKRRFLTRFFTVARIKNLERWKGNRY
ncbi:MAG: hypothetical protein CMB80_31065 [Flammeovirgaceae bacterium]|nr:hypothetical protein [Flammeovirgaceae bacterium]|tara:strand:- start:199 stop:978 length:780 start_codon:yes stop_codon:yes gene_type:complete